jgi:two-component sensor histidine kinase/FixJ family two-component response regulator
MPEAATVLVVDDILENRLMLKALLEAGGYRVILAANGVEALLALPGADAIVSDILMPTMDGYELCRRVRTDPRIANLPFAFYTATYVNREDRLFGLSLGADAYLIKPMEPQPLLDAVAALFDRGSRAAARREAEGAAMSAGLNDSSLLDEASWLRGHEKAVFAKLEKKVQDLERANAELAEAKAEAAAHAARAESLYRELLHRTRNNLQVVLSLLRLHALDPGESAESLAERMDLRVQSLLLSQELMYESGNFRGLDLARFVPEFASLMRANAPGTSFVPEIDASSEPIFLSADALAPFAFVLEELLMNAIRHAYHGRASGRIEARCALKGADTVELAVVDDGSGFVEGAERGAGLAIAEDLARGQLRGGLEVSSSGGGTRCVARFPLPPAR